MQIQSSSLFYDKKYDVLINNLTKTPEQSISKTHNITIANYLYKETNPLSELEETEKKIQKEAIIHDSWPLHPSWPLIQYHKALFYFNTGNEIQCFKTLENIWNHSKFISNYLLLFISILTQEFCIRHNNFQFADNTINFITKNFPSDQVTSNFLKGKINNPNFVTKITETVHTGTSRLKLARSIHENNSLSASFVRESLKKIDKNIDEKKKKSFLIYQILSLSGAALHQHDFKKSEIILSLAPDQQDPAVLNNRGVLEFDQKRYSSALLLFSKALSTSKSDKIVHPYQRIIYNIGVANLLNQKPKKAFRYLYSIIPLIPYFPYLWLRMAECCVLYFKQRVAKLRKRKQLTSVIARQLSTSTKKYTILPASDAALFARYANPKDSVEEKLTLEFGEKCVKNAIELVKSDESQYSLKASATLLLEYICLELGDWSEAYENSQPIILSQNQEPLTKFLSRIYASQALYMMHDYQEACKILIPCLIEVQLNKNSESAITLYQTAWRTYRANNEIERSMTYMNKLDTGYREVLLTKVADYLKPPKNKQPQPAEALIELETFCPKED